MAKAFRCELCNGIIDRQTMICKDCGLNHAQYGKQHEAQVKFDRRVNYTPRVDYTNISDNIIAGKKKIKIQNINTTMPATGNSKPKKGDYRVKPANNVDDDNKKRSPVVTIVILIIILNLISVVFGLISSIIHRII